MIVSQVYEQVKTKKLKVHFNEFMVNFHDFRHEKSEENSSARSALESFLPKIKNVVLFIDEINFIIYFFYTHGMVLIKF